MRVSIITPTYNRADLLPETIESILTQNYPHIEYLVLDDGSSDNTQSVLKKYAGRIRVEQHANMGETATVNKGFSLVTGDIICVVSSDDPLLPGAIRHAVEAFKRNPDALAAYPDWVEIGPRSEFIRSVRLPDYDFRNMLLNRDWGLGPGTFFKREVLQYVGNRNPKLVYCGDMEFWLRVALRGQLQHIPQLLATHRTHPHSASVSSRDRYFADEWVGVWQSLLHSPEMPPDIVERRDWIFSMVYWRGAPLFCGTNRMHARVLRLQGLLYFSRYVLSRLVKKIKHRIRRNTERVS